MKRPNFYIGKKNTVTFLLASIILLYGIVTSIDGFSYFFADKTPIDMGKAMQLDKDAFSKVKDGDLVQISGITSVQGGSLKKGLGSERHILFYLTGSPKFVIIESVDEDEKNTGPQQRTIKGRAHCFKTDSQAEKMRQFFKSSLFIEMDEDGMMIEADVVPGKNYWALIFFLGLILLMGLNIYLFIKRTTMNCYYFTLILKK